MIPATLGEFTIESLLGEGGSSLVYAARRTDDPTEEIALKVLHPDLGLTERETERFLDEARKLNQLHHRSIVSLRGSGRLPDGRPFLAMPRLKGHSLGDRLRSDAIPLGRALALFADVATALAALHEAGLLHRDIKPDNVFWLEPDDRLMLLDLGIARDTESSPGTTTRAGLSRGTPEYMAPERLFGQRATVKTDVYELTLLLYVMLVRRPPWTEGDAHARLEPRLDPELVAALPPALVKTIGDGLALDVNRRPESVRALLDRIEEATRGTNLDAARPSVRAAATTLPSADDIAATRLVLTPRGPIPVESSIGTARTELVGTTVAPARRSWAPVIIGGVIGCAGIGGAIFITRGASTSNASSPPALSQSASSAIPTESVEASPLPASPPSSASAEQVAPSASVSASALPAPRASAAAPRAASVPSSLPAPSSTADASSKTTPQSCTQLVALVCSPTSGATPEECSAWTENARRWQSSLPPDVAAKTCQAAFNAEKSGLELRKQSPRG